MFSCAFALVVFRNVIISQTDLIFSTYLFWIALRFTIFFIERARERESLSDQDIIFKWSEKKTHKFRSNDWFSWHRQNEMFTKPGKTQRRQTEREKKINLFLKRHVQCILFTLKSDREKHREIGCCCKSSNFNEKFKSSKQEAGWLAVRAFKIKLKMLNIAKPKRRIVVEKAKKFFFFYFSLQFISLCKNGKNKKK